MKKFSKETLLETNRIMDLSLIHILLFNHNRDKILGRVENARVENGRGLAKIIFDDDEDSLKIFQKVQSGTLRGISVGYVDLDYTYIPENTMSADGRFKGECFLVTRWQPLEVSVCLLYTSQESH